MRSRSETTHFNFCVMQIPSETEKSRLIEGIMTWTFFLLENGNLNPNSDFLSSEEKLVSNLEKHFFLGKN